MGNPHPTKSKPCKIGRKHTGAKSLRQIGRIKSFRLKQQREQAAKWRAFKKQVKAYWEQEQANFPKKP